MAAQVSQRLAQEISNMEADLTRLETELAETRERSAEAYGTMVYYLDMKHGFVGF